MGHTAIGLETVNSLQTSDAREVKKIAQCIRYIKFLSCALILLIALCIAIIGVLSWHMIRSVPYHDKVATLNQLNTETANAEIHRLPQQLNIPSTRLFPYGRRKGTANILEGQLMMIRSLQCDPDQAKQKRNERFEAYSRKVNAHESNMKLILETCSAKFTQFQKDALKLKVLSGNNFTDIKSLQGEEIDQEGTLRDLETKFQAFNTVLVSQQSALEAFGEMLQNINETMTRLQMNDVRKLIDDADKRFEDIIWLKMVSENSSADISSLQAIVKNQDETTKDLKSKFTEPSVCPEIGSTYIRWGRAECAGNDSEIVYSGYIGGSYYNHTGAASNYLCLPNEPQYDKYVLGWQKGGKIYGAEYHADHLATFFEKHLQYHVPPCAMCRSPRTGIVMIPARTTCYDGWTKEFGGYLVSGQYGHKSATEYICLDRNATFTEWSTTAKNDGRLLYLVEGNCDHNLKCPPYKSERELTCVLCSK